MKLAIEGMHCAACVRRVKQTLERTGAGPVGDVQVGSAVLDAPEGSAPAVLEALEKAGYPAKVAEA